MNKSDNKDKENLNKQETAKEKRERLMKEIDKHLKGGTELSEEELSQDKYINIKNND